SSGSTISATSAARGSLPRPNRRSSRAASFGERIGRRLLRVVVRVLRVGVRVLRVARGAGTVVGAVVRRVPGRVVLLAEVLCGVRIPGGVPRARLPGRLLRGGARTDADGVVGG